MSSLYDKFHSDNNINHLYKLLDDLIKKNTGTNIINNMDYFNYFNNKLREIFIQTRSTDLPTINKEVLKSVLGHFLKDIKQKNENISHSKINFTKFKEQTKKITSENNSNMKTSVRETPIRETPIRETPIKETPIRETSIRETQIKETPIREIPIRETPINNNEELSFEDLLSKKEKKKPEVVKTDNKNDGEEEDIMSIYNNFVQSREIIPGDNKTNDIKVKTTPEVIETPINQPKTPINQPETSINTINDFKDILDNKPKETNISMSFKDIHSTNFKENIIVSSFSRTNKEDSNLYNFKISNVKQIHKFVRCILPIENTLHFTIPILKLSIPELELNIHMYCIKTYDFNNYKYAVYEPEENDINNVKTNSGELSIDITSIYGNINYMSDIIKTKLENSEDGKYVKIKNISKIKENDIIKVNDKYINVTSNQVTINEDDIIIENLNDISEEDVYIVNMNLQSVLIFN
jgi:hypothetical protein